MSGKDKKGGALVCVLAAVFLLCPVMYTGCEWERAKGLNGRTAMEDSEEEYECPGAVWFVLNREFGWEKEVYTPEDFPEIDFIEITEIEEFSPSVWKRVKKLYDEGGIENLDQYSNFERHIFMFFSEKNDEKILNAINLLDRRKDVVRAFTQYDYHQPLGTFPGLDAQTELLIKQERYPAYTGNYSEEALKKWATTVCIVEYLGRHNGYEIIVFPWVPKHDIFQIDIAGYTFSYPYHQANMVAWKQDAERKPHVYEAYESGLFTEDDIKNIHERHIENNLTGKFLGGKIYE